MCFYDGNSLLVLGVHEPAAALFQFGHRMLGGKLVNSFATLGEGFDWDLYLQQVLKRAALQNN